MKEVKFPCRSCIYFKVCGKSTHTYPCEGRKTEKEKKQEEKKEKKNEN